jgi:hypothetical protein
MAPRYAFLLTGQELNSDKGVEPPLQIVRIIDCAPRAVGFHLLAELVARKVGRRRERPFALGTSSVGNRRVGGLEQGARFHFD